MSFSFKWPRFSDDFHHDAREMLEAALNKGSKPPIIADRIEVVELEMGTQPPDLEIRDIGDLTLDRFRGIFRLTYIGDAHIVLRTKVQANPLNHKKPDIHMLGGSRGMLAAHQPLVVPMLLRLSNFKLNAYVVLVLSKQKGITIVFKTDPLQNVDVNSTFDSIAVIQKYIQREIEGQLREMFREDLPGIIHRLSQRWVAGRTKVEAPYLSKQQPRTTFDPPTSTSNPNMLIGNIHYSSPVLGLRLGHRLLPRTSSLPRVQNGPGPSPAISTSNAHSPITPVHLMNNDTPMTFPEIENFDPTYGLRPEDLPATSRYSGFGRLFGAPKGLGDLAEEDSHSADRSFSTSSETDSYASHLSSVQRSPTPSDIQDDQSPNVRLNRQRSRSPGHFWPSESTSYGSPPDFRSATDTEGNIVLRPGLNNTISQLSTLSHSNHTLSPYTRSLEHFTVRSVPHIPSVSSPAPDRLPVRAKRQRTYRLGSKKPPVIVEEMAEQRASPSSPTPPPEFEASDVEHYFPVRHLSLRRRASSQDL